MPLSITYTQMGEGKGEEGGEKKRDLSGGDSYMGKNIVLERVLIAIC